MHLLQQSRRYSNDLIQFSQMLDLKVRERNATFAIQAEEEQADRARLAIESEETRPFDKALRGLKPTLG